MISRREFLTRTGAGTSILCLGGAAPNLWINAAAAASPESQRPILVVVELEGGNDGLNTVIPYADDLYHRSRPSLRIKPDDVLRLDDHLGLHPAMAGLHKLWEKGQLKIVGNVGYPNPNRSHSRSMEIWRGGTLATESIGWLGHVADDHHELTPCYVGDGEIPLAVRQRVGAATSISSLEDYRFRHGARLPESRQPSGDGILAQVAARFDSTDVLAQRLNAQLAAKIDAATKSQSAGDASTPLAKRLAIIQSLVEHGAEFRIFYTGVSGFDTHVNQSFAHRLLLDEVSDAVGDFVERLGQSGVGDRVVVLIFSEFGRRVAENGQAGTDHGAAAPVLLVGQSIEGGLLEGAPDLVNLDSGDLHYRIDFRDLYASLLDQWLHIDPTPILGQRNTGLSLI